MSADELRPRPLLLGHRGARRYAPENTIAAFELALQHGCDGFEFDVRRTADERSVICHDRAIFGLDVSGSNYAALCERGRAKGCEPPCLEDVLERFAGRAFLDIELKVAGQEQATLDVLRRFPPARGYFVSSFLPEVLKGVHELDARVPLGLICDREKQFAQWKALPISALHLHYDLVSRETVGELHRAGKQIVVWTVNRAEQMRDLAGLGVDGIISDDTRLLVESFRQ